MFRSNLFAHLLGNVLHVEHGLYHGDRGLLVLPEVLNQVPRLNLICQQVQVVNHVLATVNAHAGHRNVHVARLKG